MSGQCTGWVLRHGPTDRGMRMVLLTIADAANTDGEFAHPGMAAMVRGSLYSERHVQRMLGKLEAEGWIEVTEAGVGGRGLATVYRVVMENPDMVSGFSDAKPRHPERETPTSGAPIPLFPTGTTGGRASRRQLAPFPEPFVVSIPMQEWLQKSDLGHIDWRDETGKFKDWALANDIRKRDWVAAWRTWMRRADRYAAS